MGWLPPNSKCQLLEEISAADLRVGMYPATPMPPCSELPLDWVVAQSAARALFTASPASTAVPAANATSPPSPTNWFCSSSAACASCPRTAPRTNQVVASAEVIQYAFQRRSKMYLVPTAGTTFKAMATDLRD